VREGEVEGIQIAVAGADVFAGAIETAHEMHPEKLRNLGERVSHLAVLISPETVKVEECDERKRVRKFLEEVGVGMKSDDATAGGIPDYSLEKAGENGSQRDRVRTRSTGQLCRALPAISYRKKSLQV